MLLYFTKKKLVVLFASFLFSLFSLARHILTLYGFILCQCDHLCVCVGVDYMHPSHVETGHALIVFVSRVNQNRSLSGKKGTSQPFQVKTVTGHNFLLRVK